MLTAKEETEMERKLEAMARRYGFRKAETSPPAPADPPVSDAEMDPLVVKHNPNRDENNLMLTLMIVRNNLIKYLPGSKRRCREAGRWVWRDLRLVLSLVDKCQDSLLETMPQKRLEYYHAYLKHGKYVVTIEQPVKVPHEMVITDVRLGAICDAAICGECALCSREGKEIEKCPLRDALMEVAPPSRLADPAGSRFAECEYRNVASQMILGEMISI